MGRANRRRKTFFSRAILSCRKRCRAQALETNSRSFSWRPSFSLYFSEGLRSIFLSLCSFGWSFYRGVKSNISVTNAKKCFAIRKETNRRRGFLRGEEVTAFTLALPIVEFVG